MNHNNLIETHKPKHKVPYCYKCGRGFLLKGTPEGYECFDGCDKSPVTPNLEYRSIASRRGAE